MKIIPENIPSELIALPQWVFWRYETRKDDPVGKPAKVPHSSMGYRASTTNPTQWSSFDFLLELWRARPGFADGLGFVFSADDPYCGIDLDNVWQSDADEGAPWATEILERFSDTYLEESPSGKGVKIWARAKLSRRGGCWPLEGGSIEIYDQARFFTVTGRSSPVRVVADHQEDVDSLIEYLGRGNSAAAHAIGEKIPYGTQHHTLVSLAGTMHRRGMAAEAIEAALLVVNETQCEKPGPPENIRKIAQSAARWQR